ncbi:NfeD family protein [Neptuniibacter halophilus]|uniref:NfeD family protein n=1 Tax=Neptuniibacter halophilus TaxID=651666 RepID=UPI002573D625|nr:NfeD family protein [Neptuniibacter halophilus]
MLELLQSISYWHWVILALVLLGGEALGAAGFLLGISLSALLVAGAMALGLVQAWQFQFLLFALLSVIASVVVWKLFRKQNEADEAGAINDRAGQLVGRKFTLQQDLESGEGRAQIGDTFWKVDTDEALQQGCRVEVFARDGMTLKIRKIA